MIVRFLEYTYDYRILSFAKDKFAANDLLGNNLEVLFFENDTAVILPDNIPLKLNKRGLSNLSVCENYDVFEVSDNGSAYRYYSVESDDNVFLLSLKCNSNCIMCPVSEGVRKNGFISVEQGRYEGTTTFGVLSGTGTFTFNTGDIYTGEFKNNNITGTGTYAFELVNNSEKHSFYNLTLKNKLSAYALDRFGYDDSPFFISLGNIDYCIFGDVILLFDSSGYYITALNHSALKISVEKHEETVDIYSKYPSQNKTGYDSKCVKFGKTTTTWWHTRVDGRPDRRYKDNPMIRHCYNTYQYGIITIRLGDAICSCTTSSQKAITEFENIVSNKKTGQYPNVIALSS